MVLLLSSTSLSLGCPLVMEEVGSMPFLTLWVQLYSFSSTTLLSKI